ncbi:MAG TPA: GNAT family N-acetyltransferase [Candidatus Polarisedimenticolaceae bacterium]
MEERLRGARLRDATLGDFEAVAALKSRIGWGRDSAATWSWLWERNPALATDTRRPPIGWVVERDHRVVGYFGNVPQVYHYRGRRILAGAAIGLCVDPACRGAGYGMELVKAWCHQDRVDLAISTTTSPQVRTMMLAAGALDLPQPDYARALHWIVEPRGVAAALLRKAGLASPLAGAAAWPAGAALRAWDVILGRRRPSVPDGFDVAVDREPGFGPEYDDLWRRVTQTARGLLACRSAESLRWHFGGPTLEGAVRILTCRRGGALAGYAVSMRVDAAGVQLRRWRLVDLLVEHGDRAAVAALLAAAFHAAREEGAHVLEVIGYPEEIRAVFAESRPGSRVLGDCPFQWSVRSAEVAKELGTAPAWYATPYDGDAALLFLE